MIDSQYSTLVGLERYLIIPSLFFPSGAVPLPTVPVSLRSMYQLSCAPEPFFNVKAKTAPPFLIASLRSASEEERAEEMRSKASEAGNCSARKIVSPKIIHSATKSAYRL